MISEPTYLQRSVRFLGNLCALERGQDFDSPLVRGIEFGNSEDVLLLRQNRDIVVSVGIAAEELLARFLPAKLNRPVWSNVAFNDGSPGAQWIQLHFHLGATGAEMGFVVPGLRFGRIHLSGRHVFLEVTDGMTIGGIRLELLSASENAALPMDLAEAFADRTGSMTFKPADGLQ